MGIVNGLLGAGGGIILVPLLCQLGVDGKKSHATALSIIVPLSVLSGGMYLLRGWVTIGDFLPLILPGVIGAVIGGLLMKKISLGWLKIGFGTLLLFGAIKSFF